MGIRKSHRDALVIALAAYLFVGIAITIAANSPINPPISNTSCMDCHGDKTLTTTNAAGKEILLFVDLAKFATSVHKTNSCASCHSDLTAKHPDDNIPAMPVNCAVCHEGPAKEYAASIHGVSHTL